MHNQRRLLTRGDSHNSFNPFHFYTLSTLVHHVSLFMNFSHVRVSFESHFRFPIPGPSPQRHLLSLQVLPTSVSFPLPPCFPPPPLHFPASVLTFISATLPSTNPCAVDVNKHLDYTVKAASTPNPDWKLDFTFPFSLGLEKLSPCFPRFLTLSSFAFPFPRSIHLCPSCGISPYPSACLSRFVFSVLHLSSISIRYVPSVALPLSLYLSPSSVFAYLLTFTGFLPPHPLILPSVDDPFPLHAHFRVPFSSFSDSLCNARASSSDARIAQPPVFACEINAFLFRPELNASLHKETSIYSFILRVKKKADSSRWGQKRSRRFKTRDVLVIASQHLPFKFVSLFLLEPSLHIFRSFSSSSSPFQRNAQGG